jgi:hypothetical protein
MSLRHMLPADQRLAQSKGGVQRGCAMTHQYPYSLSLNFIY